MSKSYRYKKRLSDRSGFEYLDRELVRDDGVLVGPDEYDTPPPSNIPLGGEGDIAQSEYFRSDYTNLEPVSTSVLYLNTASTIPFKLENDSDGETNRNTSIIYVSGSNSAVNLSSNPQVSPAAQNDFLTIYCVGSNVVLENGSGLELKKIFNMDSGSILNLVYTTGGSVWIETSRSHITKNLGAN